MFEQGQYAHTLGHDDLRHRHRTTIDDLRTVLYIQFPAQGAVNQRVMDFREISKGGITKHR